MTKAYLALGSNLGDRVAHLRRAIDAIAKLPSTQVVRTSRFVETEPVGPPGQGPYLNAAAEVETALSARELLEELLQVEMKAGRDRTQAAVRWGPRPLDLDILLYGDQVIEAPGLTVPHPRMHQRRFVLEPLAEIAPEVRHPVLKRTVRELLEAI